MMSFFWFTEAKELYGYQYGVRREYLGCLCMFA